MATATTGGERVSGACVKYNVERGFGFIQPADGARARAEIAHCRSPAIHLGGAAAAVRCACLCASAAGKLQTPRTQCFSCAVLRPLCRAAPCCAPCAPCTLSASLVTSISLHQSTAAPNTLTWTESVAALAGVGEDIFVHQRSIVSKGFRSLATGERVEYTVSTSAEGKREAVNVTGPDGAAVKGHQKGEEEDKGKGKGKGKGGDGRGTTKTRPVERDPFFAGSSACGGRAAAILLQPQPPLCCVSTALLDGQRMVLQRDRTTLPPGGGGSDDGRAKRPAKKRLSAGQKVQAAMDEDIDSDDIDSDDNR